MQKSSWPLGKGSNTSNLINKLAPCASHRPVLIPVILTINTERRETLFHLGTHSGPFNSEIVQFQVSLPLDQSHFPQSAPEWKVDTTSVLKVVGKEERLFPTSDQPDNIAIVLVIWGGREGEGVMLSIFPFHRQIMKTRSSKETVTTEVIGITGNL